MKFSIYRDSRIGGRDSNQDRIAYCYSRDALLMVVADGMGGHLRGEVAAQIAVRYLTEAFRREARPCLPDPFLYLSWGIANAHRAIADYAVDNKLPDAPRTTCVVCVVQDNQAYWAHAGDARCYLLRDGKVARRTQDHSRVRTMIDRGEITEAEARHHPARNRVYSCLGGDRAPQVDYSSRTPLATGDTILLCTDGVWGPVEDEALAAAFTGAHPAEAGARLMDEIETRAGAHGDNLSLIAMRWDGARADETADSVETRTIPLGVHTKQLLSSGASAAGERTLTAADIERAIDEIRGVTGKQPN